MAGHWWTLAMEYAARQKMIVLGSAHAHTYRARRDEVEAIPSKGDMQPWEAQDLTCYIANVVERPNYKKCATSPRTARPPNCDVTVT
jgi:hypothetical protein